MPQLARATEVQLASLRQRWPTASDVVAVEDGRGQLLRLCDRLAAVGHRAGGAPRALGAAARRLGGERVAVGEGRGRLDERRRLLAREAALGLGGGEELGLFPRGAVELELRGVARDALRVGAVGLHDALGVRRVLAVGVGVARERRRRRRRRERRRPRARLAALGLGGRQELGLLPVGARVLERLVGARDALRPRLVGLDDARRQRRVGAVGVGRARERRRRRRRRWRRARALQVARRLRRCQQRWRPILAGVLEGRRVAVDALRPVAAGLLDALRRLH
mmetsp:Transcript_63932/g.190813  ORF Transcript_63932/g.190813 Transcript_63932/m.190813 type:complete len:280 (+) Transcript_63932:135-974(+)